MDESIAAVRSFNRTVTERVGALNDHYLARDRPLGQARVLWELGDTGCEVRVLRARLGLNSGYLSRLLRSLEAAELVTVGPTDTDGRVRAAHLTAQGRIERDLLDRRSDDLARSILDPLTDTQRRRLVTAMADVERLLTAGLIDVKVVDPDHPQAAYCLRQYFDELDGRFHSGFDPSASLPADPGEMRLPAGLFLLATLRSEPIGCGALKFHGDRRRSSSGCGSHRPPAGWAWGGDYSRELEERAAEHGTCTIRLETNKTLTEAIAMYRSAGYHEVDAFNDEPYAHHWFEKHVAPSRPEQRPEHA